MAASGSTEHPFYIYFREQRADGLPSQFGGFITCLTQDEVDQALALLEPTCTTKVERTP